MNDEQIRLCGLTHLKVRGEPKCRICGRVYNLAGAGGSE